MEDLENEELNLELCALTIDDTFESWSPETQKQVLAEWHDWKEPAKSEHYCDQCSKGFTRSNTLRRHIQTLHSGEKRFICDNCQKSFATRNKLRRYKKIHQEKTFKCQRCQKKFSRKVFMPALA